MDILSVTLFPYFRFSCEMLSHINIEYIYFSQGIMACEPIQIIYG